MPIKSNDFAKVLRLHLLLSVNREIQTESAERERISETRYQNLFEDTHDIVFTADLQGCFTSINPAAEQTLGYSRGELIGMDAFRLFDPIERDKGRSMLAAKLAGTDWTSYEANLRTKDGKKVLLEITMRLRADSNGRPFEVAGIARDISERRRLEDQFHQAQKMETIGRLAGGVAHDFNNLLTVILGYSQILLADMPLDDQQRSCVDAIRCAGERATNVARQLLTFSKKTVVHPIELNLNLAISNVTKMLQRWIGEDIELIIDLDPSLNEIMADPVQIEQILMNLAINARDAMPDGGKLTMKTISDKVTNRVMLSVTDTGSAMDEATKEHLFEPFFTTKEVGKGTGLGLATIFGIVRQNKGSVEFTSEAGMGTEFRIYLPAVTASAAAKTADELSLGVPRGSGHVLLVEDDNEVRSLVAQLLRRNRYEVTEARTGHEAIEILGRGDRQFEVLLTDVILPGITGKKLAQHAMASHANLRVVFMSGYAREVLGKHGVVSDDANLITKPFTECDLMRSLQFDPSTHQVQAGTN